MKKPRVVSRFHKDTFISKDYTENVAMNYSGIEMIPRDNISKYLDSSAIGTQSTAFVDKIRKESAMPVINHYKSVTPESTVESTSTMTQDTELQDMENTELENMTRDESEGMTRKRIK